MNTPHEIDTAFRWPLGRAERLARRGRLPHLRLPDGSIRFSFDEVSKLITRVNPPALCKKCGIPTENAENGLCILCGGPR